MTNIIDGPVVPIPPSYSEFGLFFDETEKYLKWLSDNDVNTIMTTAGTSQFNIMSSIEIRSLNVKCADFFPKAKILGIPPLSLSETIDEIHQYNKFLVDKKDIYLMLLYPDRYYGDSGIVDFFHRAADVSNFPILIHGMFMRSGTGGMYDFTASLVNQIRQHDNIIGMKEECTSFELAYDMCRNTGDFIKIVAGKSARRFTLLSKANADTYLAGLGNLFPQLENELFKCIKSGADHTKYLRDYEDPFFDVFMKIGWHKALREGLRQEGLCCSLNRAPFPNCTDQEKETIRLVLETIKEKLTNTSD